MTPEERLTSAVSAARRAAPSDAAANRLRDKLATLGPVPAKLPLVFKIGAPLVVALAGLAYWQSTRHTDASPPQQPSTIATAPVVSIAPAPTQVPDNAVSVDDLPIAKAPPVQTAPKVDPNAELALVSRAESVLASDPAGALALTDEHQKKYPNGQLVIEREVIAVEALAKLGRKTEARRRSDELLAHLPDSPYRVRLERALR